MMLDIFKLVLKLYDDANAGKINAIAACQGDDHGNRFYISLRVKSGFSFRPMGNKEAETLIEAEGLWVNLEHPGRNADGEESGIFFG